MISPRRVRMLVFAVAIIVFCLLYYSSSSQHASDPFYQKTVAAMNKKADTVGGGGYGAGAGDIPSAQSPPPIKADPNVNSNVDDAEQKATAERVQQVKAAEKARTETGPGSAAGANKKNTDARGAGGSGATNVKQEPLNGEGVGVAAGAKGVKQPGVSGGGSWVTGDKEGTEKKSEASEKTDEERKVEAELNGILKRSPIIIFSKSYCPHSKRAKGIFAKYSITPAPFIVELDIESLGPQLQDLLHKNTGRRTVPNILINGRSIGGGDEVAALDEEGKLVEKIQSMGGKRVMEAKLKA